MPNRPTLIALSDAAPGMTLSDAVLDTKGNILLPAETVLSAALIDSLARHDIERLAVRGIPAAQVDADAERDRQIGRVEWLFRHAGPAQAAEVATSNFSGGTAGQATRQLHRLILNFRSDMAS